MFQIKNLIILIFINPLVAHANDYGLADFNDFSFDFRAQVTTQSQLMLSGIAADILSELSELNQINKCGKELMECRGESCRANVTSCLPLVMRENMGRTFANQGPNCFATALKAKGINLGFRSVDEPEFRAYVQLACEKVKTPRPGDLGVFQNPNNLEFSHVYTYLTNGLGFDKPGVDYNEKTPVRARKRSSIIYAAISSTECKQYAPDPSVCSNLHYYLRCGNINFGSSSWILKHNSDFLRLENKVNSYLDKRPFSSIEKAGLQSMVLEFKKLNQDLINNAEQEVRNEVLKSYLKARLDSLKDQLIFFDNKIIIL